MTTYWIPLESNPEVFNAWANKAGLVSSAQFHDIYGLDSESLSMIPRPVHAVLLVFPYGEGFPEQKAEDERIAKERGETVDGTVIWIKQTIGGACGAIALIHGIANSAVNLSPESPLQTFIAGCTGKSPLDRARLLETTPLLANIHASVAGKGQSAVPSSGVRLGQAYTCFVAAPKMREEELESNTRNADADVDRGTAASDTARRVVELDGTRAGPVDRGVCTDLLEDIAQIVRKEFIQRNDSVKFSLMYLGQPMRE